MGKIIGVLNQKGGVGKSTLTAHLALTLHTKYNPEKNDRFVCVYDSDRPQYSVSSLRKEEQRILQGKKSQGNNYYDKKFMDVYSDLKPFPIYEASISEAVEKFDVLKKNFEYTFIDVVGTTNTEGYDQEFMANFDYVIVPMTIKFDVIRSTIDFVKNVIYPIHNSGQIDNYCIILNDVDKRQENKYITVQKDLREKGYQILESVMNSNEKYVNLYLHEGTGILSSLYPKYDRAIYQVVEEIFNL